MSSTYADRLANRLVQTTRKIADLQANRLAHERLVAVRLRKKERRARLRRRIELGSAIETAGLSDWKVAELVGALLDLRDRIGASKTQRMAAQKRGEQHMGRPHLPTPDKPHSPDATDPT